MPIRLHCNELSALCLRTNVLCRTAEFGALLLECVLIVYIWPEKGVYRVDDCVSMSCGYVIGVGEMATLLTGWYTRPSTALVQIAVPCMWACKPGRIAWRCDPVLPDPVNIFCLAAPAGRTPYQPSAMTPVSPRLTIALIRDAVIRKPPCQRCYRCSRRDVAACPGICLLSSPLM